MTAAKLNCDPILASATRKDASQRTFFIRGFAAILAWLVMVCVGMLLLIDYSSAPGTTNFNSDSWPNNSEISRGVRVPTLIMFLHPRCPCSRASLNELARLLADRHGTVAIRTVFFCPDGESEAWAQTGHWDLAARLSDDQPIVDLQGREAGRFGASTSGYVCLFSQTGKRLFGGGITSGRGHEGENLGSQAVQQLLDGTNTEPVSYPVYGCPIQSNLANSR